MSAIATNGVVPGRACVCVCVGGEGSWLPARSGSCRKPCAPEGPDQAWQRAGKTESIAQGCPAPWAMPAKLCSHPAPRSGGRTSPPAAPQPSATSPRGFPVARGERGAGAATRPQSRKVQMAARAASRGSSLRQTGEAAREPGRHAGRRMGSRAPWAGRWGGLSRWPPRAAPDARTLLCVVSTPGEALVGSGRVGAPGLPPPEHAQPRRAPGELGAGELCQPR